MTEEYNIFSDTTKQDIETIKRIASNKKIGFTCSTFDLIHPGHIIMLDDAKNQCDFLVIALQTDPTIDRDNKNKPIQTWVERKIMISAIKYVDYVIKYATEDDLYKILKELNPDVRIIGSDWKGKKYTGYDINTITIYWHNRDTHDYSTSNLRNRIYDAEVEKRQD